jgi:hypothetical protein
MVYKKKIVLIIQLLNITNYLQALEHNSLIIKTAAAVTAIAVGGISLKLHQYLSFQTDSKKLQANIAKVLEIESKDSFLEEFNLEKFDTKLIGSTKAKTQEESSRIEQDYLNIAKIQAETQQYLQKWSNKLSSTKNGTKNGTEELKQAENLIRENEIRISCFDTVKIYQESRRELPSIKILLESDNFKEIKPEEAGEEAVGKILIKYFKTVSPLLDCHSDIEKQNEEFKRYKKILKEIDLQTEPIQRCLADIEERINRNNKIIQAMARCPGLRDEPTQILKHKAAQLKLKLLEKALTSK